jgi:hypothetical protein
LGDSQLALRTLNLHCKVKRENFNRSPIFQASTIDIDYLASKGLQNATEQNLNLPAFYTVGLLGYCQGQNMASVTNCSRPSIRFTFDLLKILRTVPKKIEIPLPDGENKALESYHGFTRWFILAYLVGAFATILTIIFGIGSMIFTWRINLILFVFAFVSCSPNCLKPMYTNEI